MTRDLDYFAARVAYPCIFARSVDDAAKNLADLIANQLCGFDQGIHTWRVALDSFARNHDALDRLEIMGRDMGAPFTRAEWRALAETALKLSKGGGDV